MNSGLLPSCFELFWAEVNNLQFAWQGWSGSDLPGSCSVVIIPFSDAAALVPGAHGREGKLLFFGENQRAQLHPAWPEPFLLGLQLHCGCSQGLGSTVNQNGHS